MVRWRRCAMVRWRCQKDDFAKHLGVGCRRNFHRNGENAGQLRQVRRKKCQRATQAWPGLLTAESSASDICPVADATAAAAATAADPTRLDSGSSARKRLDSGSSAGKRGAQPSAGGSGQGAAKRTRRAPKRYARNTLSAEQTEKRPRGRKRNDGASGGNGKVNQKRRRRLGMEEEQTEKQAAAAAAAAAAAEEELLGGDLSGKDIRFLARCLGVKGQYEEHLDVICKLVRANLRWGVRGGER